jgi:hypothetical protein
MLVSIQRIGNVYVSPRTSTNHFRRMYTVMVPTNAHTVSVLQLIYVCNKLLHVSASHVAFFRDVKYNG